MNDDTANPAYGVIGLPIRHRLPATDRPVVTDLAVAGLAVAVAGGVWSGDLAVAACLAVAATLPFRTARLTVIAVALATVGAVRSQHAWAGLAPDTLGPFHGWVTIVDDPQPFGASTRLIVEVDGERYEIWSRGRAQQLRVRRWRGGQLVLMSGERSQLATERAGRVAWQHVVGEFELAWASDVFAGDPVARACNRVRSAIERAASSLPADDGALFRGLVVGDDRDQPRPMIERFRASGLSHLTAVSG